MRLITSQVILSSSKQRSHNTNDRDSLIFLEYSCFSSSLFHFLKFHLILEYHNLLLCDGSRIRMFFERYGSLPIYPKRKKIQTKITKPLIYFLIKYTMIESKRLILTRLYKILQNNCYTDSYFVLHCF